MEQTASRHKIKISLFVWKYFTWLNIVFFLTLIFFGYTYIIKPKYNTIGEQTAQALDKLQAEKEKRENYLNRLIRLNRQFQKISKEDRQKVDKVLASEPDMENLLKQMELIIKENGFLIQSLSVTVQDQSSEAADKNQKILKPKKKEPEIGKIKIELGLAGVDYYNLKRLLNIFEQNVRLMDVNKIDFEPSSETVDLTIFTYYEINQDKKKPEIK